ncbi:Uncharacterised protein [Mycobacteroides abscessus subsp. massiliense]|nr:Uncharacterised protein [Mycobacteroides abscessus subsp. massiliense]
MTGRKVLDAHENARKVSDLTSTSLGEESLGDPPLIEDFDGARMQARRTRSHFLMTAAALQERDIDARKGQLTGQHQSGRACARDNNRMLSHNTP